MLKIDSNEPLSRQQRKACKFILDAAKLLNEALVIAHGRKLMCRVMVSPHVRQWCEEVIENTNVAGPPPAMEIEVHVEKMRVKNGKH